MTRPSFPFIYTFHLASSHLSCLSAAKVLHQMLQDEGFQAARQRLYSYQDVPQDMLAATQAAKVTLGCHCLATARCCKQQMWHAWHECRRNPA